MNSLSGLINHLRSSLESSSKSKFFYMLSIVCELSVIRNQPTGIRAYIVRKGVGEMGGMAEIIFPTSNLERPSFHPCSSPTPY